MYLFFFFQVTSSSVDSQVRRDDSVVSYNIASDSESQCLSEDETQNEPINPSESLRFPSCVSPEVVSCTFHDYLGPVEYDSFKTLNKAVQVETDGEERRKTYCSASSQTTVQLVSTGTQTDYIDISQPELKSVGTQVKKPDLVYEDIAKSDRKVMFYTGIPDAGTFLSLFDEMSDAYANTKRNGDSSVYGRPRLLRTIDEFFLVMMRLQLGLLVEDIAQRFHISKSTCGVIINKWINYLSKKLSFLCPWPSKKVIMKNMPLKFKKKYPSCRVIIDCTEIYTETPQSLKNKSLMYSHYKSHMTYKALIGISPNGVITFASDLWAGSVSDKQLTKSCGILELCEPGDAIMADKGFLISDMTSAKGIKLIIPPFKTKRFSRREIEETRRIAHLRIDVERAIERVKNFRILQGNMPITLSQQASNIWKICVQCSNLQPPLINDNLVNE